MRPATVVSLLAMSLIVTPAAKRLVQAPIPEEASIRWHYETGG